MSNLISDSIAGLGRGEGPIDERPLNDQERAQVSRLLSDPFAFPQTFKAWLISFLESSDLTLPISSIVGLSSTLGLGGSSNTSFIKGLLPPGTIMPWGSARIPGNSLLCDGVAYSRAGYSGLFSEIGSTWGGGDGVTSFNVPDLRRRIPIGAGSGAYPLGTSDGLAEAVRSLAHHHNFAGGAHSHHLSIGVSVNGGTDGVGDHAHSFQRADPIFVQRQGGTAGAFFAPVDNLSYASAGTSGAGAHSHGVSASGTVDGNTDAASIGGDTSGGGEQDRPSFIVLNYIIIV